MEILDLLLTPTLETLYMVFLSGFFSITIGLIIGISLVVFDSEGLNPKPRIYKVLSAIVNLSRSIPFIILMILLFPLSRIIVGTTIGTTATIVPLSIGAAPMAGRIVESALKEVDRGVIEAVKAMGASNKEIVLKVLLPEALPGLILGLTLMIVSLIGYSAMAGAIGGGGLGDLAIRFGLHRFQTDVLLYSVLIIVALVQIIQESGNKLANNILKTR
ncbi:MAG: methionine ABC transporter permease [Acidaminobacteraceae bacterium]